MSTATTVGTTSVNVPANYDFIEPAPYDAPGSASFGKKTDGAICRVTLDRRQRDAALPFGDAQAVIDDIHENLDDDQGLIEVDTAREQGFIVEMTLVCRVVATMPYSLYDRVRDLAERSGAHVVGTDYAADVRLAFAFRAGEEVAFVSAMRELANGEDLCEIFAPEFAEF